MSTIVNIVLPIFGIMAAGYLAGRFRLLTDGSSLALSRFVFLISMPALVFIKVSRIPAEEFFDWAFLGALGGGMAVMLILGFAASRWFFRDSLTEQGLHGLTAMYSSTAYVGLPVLLTAYGDAALVPGIIGAVITGTLFLPLGILLAELDRGRQEGQMALAPIMGALRSPILLATAAGLAVSALGIPVPIPVAKFCDLLAGAFVPCALFAAGLFMVGCSVKGDKMEISWLIAAKLLIHPLITWWLAFHVFELEGILPSIAVLQAALPSGVPVFVLAQNYGRFESRSSAVIVLSTALSVFTLSVLLVVLEVG